MVVHFFMHFMNTRVDPLRNIQIAELWTTGCGYPAENHEMPLFPVLRTKQRTVCYISKLNLIKLSDRWATGVTCTELKYYSDPFWRNSWHENNCHYSWTSSLSAMYFTMSAGRISFSASASGISKPSQKHRGKLSIRLSHITHPNFTTAL